MASRAILPRRGIPGSVGNSQRVDREPGREHWLQNRENGKMRNAVQDTAVDSPRLREIGSRKDEIRNAIAKWDDLPGLDAKTNASVWQSGGISRMQEEFKRLAAEEKKLSSRVVMGGSLGASSRGPYGFADFLRGTASYRLPFTVSMAGGFRLARTRK